MIGRITDVVRTQLSLSRLGTVLIATGAGMVIAGILFPGLVAALFPSIATPTASSGATAVLGLCCLAIGAVAIWRRTSPTDQGPLTLHPPEAADSESIALAGRAVDRRISQAVSLQPKTLEYEPRSEAEIDERLREAAVDTYQRVTGVPAEVAVDAVDSGVWTDDQIAALRVGETDQVELPPVHWLRRRIDPKGAYELEIERTAAAIEDLGTND